MRVRGPPGPADEYVMEKQSLASFVSRINEQGLPILARTAQFLSAIVADEKSSVADMANLILQDSAITARVIRLANSAFYNRSSRKISTVNRAIVKLGMKAIQSICISAALVENVLAGRPRERVIREMIQAFQAAIHARSFALARRESNVEEVFVAALLLRIGHLAFWCLGGELADRLEKAMAPASAKPSTVEKEVLGFTLDQLTLELQNQWLLGDLLEKAYCVETPQDSRVHNLFLSHKLTQATQEALDGWNDPNLQAHLKTVSLFIQRPQEQVKDLIRENIGEAIELISQHGLAPYLRFVRLPDDSPAPTVLEPQQEEGDELADALLQTEILQELSELIKSGRPDINVLFSTLMEGISRSMHMDRVVLLIQAPDRRKLSPRYVIGPGLEKIRDMSFTAGSSPRNIFDHVLETRKPLWVNASQTPKLLEYLTPEILSTLCSNSFFLMSLSVKDRPVGVVYADRLPNGRKLDEESFVSFQFFSRLANLGLSTLAAQGTDEKPA